MNAIFRFLFFFVVLYRIFKLSSRPVQRSEHILHASVLSMVEFDDDIYAAGHCFDWNQHMAKKGLFCPFAHRLPPPEQSSTIVKDLATEYPYLGNTSEWFFLARKNAEKVIAKNEQYIKCKLLLFFSISLFVFCFNFPMNLVWLLTSQTYLM